MSITKAPFSCTYSPNMAELLWELNCTIAITTYQAGKVVFFSATSPNNLIQLPRNFEKAMGLALDKERMAVATKSEVIVLANAPALAPNYGKQQGAYDGLFIPRATYYSGEIDLHDMAWGQAGLVAVNTRFSCLSIIDDRFSFQPLWKPHFITDLVPHDRCHLNGMVMVDGKPRYVTALGKSDTPKGWRPGVETGGILMDVDSNQIVASGLPMPHSPRIYDNQVYVLLSATGELARVDVQKGTYEVITRFNGFVRGMAKQGDFLFIGLSRLRQNSSTFRDLPIAQKALQCGISVVHLPSGNQVGYIQYENSVEELYDIQILNGMRRPGILATDTSEHRMALVTPQDSYWSSPEPEIGHSK